MMKEKLKYTSLTGKPIPVGLFSMNKAPADVPLLAYGNFLGNPLNTVHLLRGGSAGTA
jgi:hypothetical protein